MSAEKTLSQHNERKPGLSDEMIQQLRQLVDKVQYGSVSLIIQDGKVVQIDKNEKIRFR